MNPIIRRIFPFYILLVTLIGCDWKVKSLDEQAKKDIEFITQTLKENHPGPYNIYDPEFMAILKRAHQAAINKATNIKSIDEYAHILTEYASQFNDSHLRIYIHDIYTNAIKDTPEKEFKLKNITPSIVWVTLPTFETNTLQQQQLDEIIKQLPKYRSYDTIIFDIRNNGGGHDLVGRNVLKALFGSDFIDQQIKKMSQDEYADWRVSKDNIAFLTTLISTAKKQFGTENPAVQSLTLLYEKMQQALVNGNKLVSERDESHEPSLTSEKSAKLCSSKIILIINHGCWSACLKFIDSIKALEHPIILVGQTTGADSLYMDIRTVELPSSLGTLVFPMKVYRNRPRGHNQPYKPDIEYPGNINDTPALEQWIKEKIIDKTI